MVCWDLSTTGWLRTDDGLTGPLWGLCCDVDGALTRDTQPLCVYCVFVALGRVTGYRLEAM